MNKEIYAKILKKLAGINIALIGTANMAIQGIDVSPNDIDFLTSDEDLKKIANIFSSAITTENIYRETEIEIDSHSVHFVTAEDNPLRTDDVTKKIIIRKWDIEIPCMPLKSELAFYERMGTPKAQQKAELIKQAIEK